MEQDNFGIYIARFPYTTTKNQQAERFHVARLKVVEFANCSNDKGFGSKIVDNYRTLYFSTYFRNDFNVSQFDTRKEAEEYAQEKYPGSSHYYVEFKQPLLTKSIEAAQKTIDNYWRRKK